MIPLIVSLTAMFVWLLKETDWLRVQLPLYTPTKPKTDVDAIRDDAYEPSRFEPCDLPNSEEQAGTTININAKIGRLNNAYGN